MNPVDFYLTLDGHVHLLVIIGIVFLVLVCIIAFYRDKRYPLVLTEEQQLLYKRRCFCNDLIDTLHFIFLYIAFAFAFSFDLANFIEQGLIVLP